MKKGFNNFNNFPLRVDSKGSTSSTQSEVVHIRQLVEQILFTVQGERVNRPTFGTGVNQLNFEPNSDEIATATQLLISANLQQWMSDTILVEAVVVTNDESTLNIVIQYVIKKTLQREVINFIK